MEYKGSNKTRCCVGICILCSILSGCSLSFCGLTTGGGKELEFTCNEELPLEVSDEEAGSQHQELPAEVLAEQQVPEENLIDLNTADKTALMTLNGIGESRAEAILAYRREQGAFTTIEDIMQVPGIKEGIFSKIKDQITVR